MRQLFVIAFYITISINAVSQNKYLGSAARAAGNKSDKQFSKTEIWVFGISGIIFLGSIAFFLRSQKDHQFQQQQKMLERKFNLLKRKNVKEQAALLRQIEDLENQIFITQINPHFIFNCLNAINYFILQNETQAASDYLTKCAALIRRVLQNAAEKTIPLTEEIATLNLYLELEQFRLKNLFTYTVQQKNIAHTEELMVPPLILQPFVENAIWHGLMPKKVDGILNITIEKEGNRLSFVITDNGVGRQKKLGRATATKPIGLDITARRLHLLNDKNQQSFLQIIDLKDVENKSNGTKVVLKIPVKLSPAAAQV